MTNALASLALIKATWDTDQQNDFTDIFVLFIITLFNRKGYNFVASDDLVICADFETEFGFSLPYHPMRAVLKKATKRGYFKRSHRKYYPVWDKIKRDDISEIAEEQEARHTYIIEEFLQFCTDEYDETLSREDADQALISFLHDHNLDILFAVQDGLTVLPPVDNTSASHRFLMLQFINHVITEKFLAFRYIAAISIGHLIANTMLIREYSQMQGKLKNVNVYLDTGFLFKISGTNGRPMREAYEEWVQLACSQGISLFVFRHTFGEFLEILENCLHFIESDRFDPSKANQALLYFRDEGWSSSDIEEFILHIDENLASFGIKVIDPPDFMTAMKLQIDEEKLQELIVEIYKKRNPNFIEEEKEYSIYKDVESITYVYKLRKGNLPRNFTKVRHVFVTTNSALADASWQYEYSESGAKFHYIPAALTDVFLGTMLWIRSPTRVQINEKRLIAHAYAATIPSGFFRERLVKNAKNLQKRRLISEEEVVLLTEDRTARNLLQKETLGNPNQLSENKLIEALEIIRSGIRQEETEAFRSAREGLEARVQKAERQTRITEEEKHRQQELTRLQWKELVRIKEHLDNNAKKRANTILWLSFVVLVVFYIIIWLLIDLVGWNKAEFPFSYFLSAVPFLLSYFYFIITKRAYKPDEIYEKIVESFQMEAYTNAGFNLARFQELQANADSE